MKTVTFTAEEYKSGDYIDMICEVYKQHLDGGRLLETLIFRFPEYGGYRVLYEVEEGWGDEADHYFDRAKVDADACDLHRKMFDATCTWCQGHVRRELDYILVGVLKKRLEADRAEEYEGVSDLTKRLFGID